MKKLLSIYIIFFNFFLTGQVVAECPPLADFANQHVSIKGDLDTQINFTSQEFSFMKGPKIPSPSNDKEKVIVSLTSEPETCLKGIELLNQALSDPAVFSNPAAIPTCFPFGSRSLSLKDADILNVLAQMVTTINFEQLRKFHDLHEQIVQKVMNRSQQAATVEATLPFLSFAFNTTGSRLLVAYVEILKKYPHLELFEAQNLDADSKKMLADYADALLPIEVGTLLEKLTRLAPQNSDFQMARLHYRFVSTFSRSLAPIALLMSDPSTPDPTGEKGDLIKELSVQNGPLNALIKKNPQAHFLTYIDLAFIKSILSKPEKGFQIIDQGLKIFPDEPELLNWAVVFRLIALQKDQTKEAVYYKQITDILAPRLEKLDVNFKLLLAKAYLANRESKKARDVLLSINEKEREVYAWVGLALTSLNDLQKDQAKKEAEMALNKAKDQTEKDEALFLGKLITPSLAGMITDPELSQALDLYHQDQTRCLYSADPH